MDKREQGVTGRSLPRGPRPRARAGRWERRRQIYEKHKGTHGNEGAGSTQGAAEGAGSPPKAMKGGGSYTVFRFPCDSAAHAACLTTTTSSQYPFFCNDCSTVAVNFRQRNFVAISLLRAVTCVWLRPSPVSCAFWPADRVEMRDQVMKNSF